MAENNLFSNLMQAPEEVDTKKVDATEEPEVIEDNTDVIEENDDEQEEIKVSEIDMLKQRATLMGIKFSPNIGVEALKAKISEKLNPAPAQQEPAPVVAQKAQEGVQDVKAAPVAQKPKTLRKLLVEENMKLIRLRITNLDPKDKDLPGQIVTVANEYLGTVSKFVPFGESTDNGYHVPYCIYKWLKAQKFLQIRVTKKQNNDNHVETALVRKFALEILPQLTPEEISRLASAQLASGAID